MSLAKVREIEIVNKSKDIEARLLAKYKKIDEGLTFGGKMKFIQDKMKNPFLSDAIWSIIKIRNHVVHDNDIKVSLKEYKLFISLYEYIILYLK